MGRVTYEQAFNGLLDDGWALSLRRGRSSGGVNNYVVMAVGVETASRRGITRIAVHEELERAVLNQMVDRIAQCPAVEPDL